MSTYNLLSSPLSTKKVAAEVRMPEYSDQEQLDLRRFGEAVRALRSRKNFSQESFAYAAGLHRTYMGGVERGERNLSLLNILKIARCLDVDPGELFKEYRGG